MLNDGKDDLVNLSNGNGSIVSGRNEVRKRGWKKFVFLGKEFSILVWYKLQ